MVNPPTHASSSSLPTIYAVPGPSILEHRMDLAGGSGGGRSTTTTTSPPTGSNPCSYCRQSVLDYGTEAALESALSLQAQQQRVESGQAASIESQAFVESHDGPCSSAPKAALTNSYASSSSSPPLDDDDEDDDSSGRLKCLLSQQQSQLKRDDDDEEEGGDDDNDVPSSAYSTSSSSTTTTTANCFYVPRRIDWRLDNVDPNTAIGQSLDHELRRLLLLKSYSVLDEQGSSTHATLDRLTTMTSRLLQAPIALISLIDLGRCIVTNVHGPFPEHQRIHERRASVCSHAILSKNDLLVVPDLTKDHRFKNLDVVKPDNGIRFYAGFALKFPEGYNLGALAVVDVKPRPNGLSSDEEASLRDIARLVVDVFVSQKTIRTQRDQLRKASSKIASASHDLTTPLSALQLSLSLLHGDDDFHNKLSDHQREFLDTIATCSSAMGDVCESLRSAQNGGGVEEEEGDLSKTRTDDAVVEASASESGDDHASIDSSSAIPLTASFDGVDLGTIDVGKSGDDGPHLALQSSQVPSQQHPRGRRLCDLQQIVARVRRAAEALPSRVPLAITVETGAIPTHFWSNDLQVFQVLLDLLSHACERTKTGCIHLLIRVVEESDNHHDNDDETGSCRRRQLRFDCRDTGPVLPTSGCSTLSTEATAVPLPESEPLARTTMMSWSPLGDDDGSNQQQQADVLLLPDHQHRLQFIAAVVSELGGQFGMMASSDGAIDKTTTFWVSIPMIEQPPSDEDRQVAERKYAPSNNTVSSYRSEVVDRPLEGSVKQQPSIPNAASSLTASCTSSEAPRYAFGTKRSHPETSLAMTEAFFQRRPPPQVDQHHTKKARRALVIDDSLVVRKVLASALSTLGFDAHQAVDGMEGLRKLQATKFDLVLCDFLMPVMDGLDCVREYRRWEEQHRPHFRQYIVGMSAHASPNDVERGLSLGMNDYRTKPVTLGVLKCLQPATASGMTRCDSSNASMAERRLRSSSPTSLRVMDPDGGATTRVCLVATANCKSREQIGVMAAKHGWSAVSAESGPEALGLLKRRNWGVALLDSNLNDLSGECCIIQFREWEKMNRIHRQNNLFLLSSDLNALNSTSDTVSVVKVPDGVDGALHSPPTKEDLEGMFRVLDSRVPAFRANDIVTR